MIPVVLQELGSIGFKVVVVIRYDGLVGQLMTVVKDLEIPLRNPGD